MERIVRAKLISYDASTHTAAVELADAPGTVLTVPVMADVGGHLLTAGASVAVLTWADVGGVLVGPYGTVPSGNPQMPGEYLYIYDTETYIRRRTDASETHLATDRDALLLAPGDAAGTLALSASAAYPPSGVPTLGTFDARFGAAYLNGIDTKGNILRYTGTARCHYGSRVILISYPPDNTYFDVITFSCPGEQTSSNHRGVCSGLLILSLNNRQTLAPPQELWSALYFVTVFSCYTSNMTAQVQQIGTANQWATQPITASFRVKAGATRTALTLEASFTCANWYTYGAVVFHLDMHSHASHSSSYITPEIAI